MPVKDDTASMTPAGSPLLPERLRNLKLPAILRDYAKIGEECSKDNATYDGYLDQLCQCELLARESNAVRRRINDAHFPSLKELADFRFAEIPKLNKSKVIELAKGDFLKNQTNVVLVGTPGIGKTHLAIAIAMNACRAGSRVRFFTASELVNTYLEAREERTILRLEASLKKLDLIVVDELGYLPLDRRGAEHLFGFFSLCYEQVSLIVTTNLPFAQWPQTLAGDERMTGALLDRLTHRVEILAIEGESYRLRQSLDAKSTPKKN
jgi:DNA replication protein DnaC